MLPEDPAEDCAIADSGGGSEVTSAEGGSCGGWLTPESDPTEEQRWKEIGLVLVALSTNVVMTPSSATQRGCLLNLPIVCPSNDASSSFFR